MAADDVDDMAWLEEVQDPRSDERSKGSRRIQTQPDHQSVGRSFPDNAVSHKPELEALRRQCRSPRHCSGSIFSITNRNNWELWSLCKQVSNNIVRN